MPPIRTFTATRRNLPHWQQPGCVYFVTWRARNEVVLPPEDRTIALNAIRFWDGKRWFVYCTCVMPDHVHVLARPLPMGESPGAAYFDLGGILHSAKAYSAKSINARSGRTGSIWQDERYDRIVRDDTEFGETWEYIRNNPVKAGLVMTPEEYPWLYEAGIAD